MQDLQPCVLGDDVLGSSDRVVEEGMPRGDVLVNRAVRTGIAQAANRCCAACLHTPRCAPISVHDRPVRRA